MASKVACIGGGVIGGGWVARFLLHGVDVAVYDPAPQAQRTLDRILANAERVYPGLYAARLPAMGRLELVSSIGEAVAGAAYVQESVPERLELKSRVYAEIEAATDASVPIGSSTSGFTPSTLQAGLARPGNVVVTHPFNPVYLLPLVEVVASPASGATLVERVSKLLSDVGMKPLIVRKEIDAHIADRFLEAVWREGLWLVKDGIATTQEIDDAIRYGFGLRWAQMGLFETFRIAGGEAGMAHFIEQFGPALKWPWTKLTDVPELTDELIERVASQSDAQSGAHSIDELERIRDDNLVGILLALKHNDWGAGALLNAQERCLQASSVGIPASDPSQPLRLVERTVPPSWLDYNGHMTEHRYLQVFSDASDALLALIGVDTAYVTAGASYYTVETHILHKAEVAGGAPLYVTTQLLASDDKRLHLFHRVHHGKTDALLASAEQMLLHVDARAGRACAAPASILDRLQPIVAAHAALPRPDAVGRHIGQRG